MIRQTINSNPDGSLRSVRNACMYEYPFVLTTNPPNTQVTVGANNHAGPISMSVSGDGPAQIVGLGAQWGNDSSYAAKLLLKIKDGNNVRPLMNGACHIGTIFGANGLPYQMAEPLYVDELRRVFVEYTDLSGFSNAIRLAAICKRNTKLDYDPTIAMGRKRQDFRQFLAFPQWFTFDDGPVTLTGNGTAEKTITIGADAHFWMEQITYVSTGAFKLNIINTANGESLIDAPSNSQYELPAAMILGTAQYPACMVEPRLFEVGQQILITMTDTSGSSNTVYLTMAGKALADRMWR